MFSNVEFMPVHIIHISWTEHDGRTFLNVFTKGVLPVYMNDSDLDLAFLSLDMGGQLIISYLQCDIETGKIIPIHQIVIPLMYNALMIFFKS
jgi:hypothetical protein